MKGKRAFIWLCIFFMSMFGMENEEVSSGSSISYSSSESQEESVQPITPLNKLLAKVIGDNLGILSADDVAANLTPSALNVVNHELVTPLLLPFQESRALDPEEVIQFLRPIIGDFVAVLAQGRGDDVLIYQLVSKPTQSGAGEFVAELSAARPNLEKPFIAEEYESDRVIYLLPSGQTNQQGKIPSLVFEKFKLYGDYYWRIRYQLQDTIAPENLANGPQPSITQNKLLQLMGKFVGNEYVIPYQSNKEYDLIREFPEIQKLILGKDGIFEIIDTESWQHLATVQHPQHNAEQPVDVYLCGTKILTHVDSTVRVWDLEKLNALQELLLLDKANAQEVFHCIQQATTHVAQLYKQDEQREANKKKYELIQRLKQLNINSGLKKVLIDFVRLKECSKLLGSSGKIKRKQI